MDSFRAYRIDEENGKIVAGFEELTVDDLTEGNVVVRVSHSTINYKDALAATGKARILRRYPLNGGIDLAGVVIRSEDEEFQPGTEVLVNGCGLSETVDGGYSEIARVDNNSLVAIPDGMSAFEAMQIGTAGYTAANSRTAGRSLSQAQRVALAVLLSTCWRGAVMTSLR